MEPISNMFSSILNNERRHKHECIVYPASKLMGQVLRVMQKYGYVGEFEFVDDGRGGKFKIQLLGRVNNCGSVRPRFSTTIGEFEKWGRRYLPSRDVGILILTTPKGVFWHTKRHAKRAQADNSSDTSSRGRGSTARFETLQRTLQVPENVSVQIEGRIVKVKGPLGALVEDLSHLPVSLSVEQNQVRLQTVWPRKREIGMLGTAAAHVRNMIKGVTQGYKYDLRTVYAHFPVTVRVDEKAKVLKIENFTGEKTPRYAQILDGVKVAIKGDDISVEGVDLKSVSQTAANIQDSTRIKEKDLRVFLDGIYISAKGPAHSPHSPSK